MFLKALSVFVCLLLYFLQHSYLKAESCFADQDSISCTRRGFNQMFLKALSVFVCLLLYFLQHSYLKAESCFADQDSISCKPSLKSQHVSSLLSKRFLLYEVNPGEGFNLRRDVYMRVATLVKRLNEDSGWNQWTLVLPPWGPLYHWKSKSVGFQAQIKWSKFFDTSSLAEYVPVMKLQEYLSGHSPVIDVVYYLQHYSEGWKDDRWEERIDVRECIEPPSYAEVEGGHFAGWFWGLDVVAREHHCLSLQGYSSTLRKFLSPLSAKAVMIDRAEVMLHDSFGDAEYWRVRKSMVFSKELIAIGDSFRKKFLNSTDELDNTHGKERNGTTARDARGGPYIAVHLRRQDFAVSRSKDVPTVRHAAEQILKWMARLKLQLVFVATDAPKSEFKEFQQLIPSAVRFVPDQKTHRNILDGGVAIVDQWICAHSRFFIGTYESTFSFRIHEEREILGFPTEMTFNRLCGDNQTSCKQPAKWTIVYN